MTTIKFQANRILHAMLLLLIVVWAIAAIDPLYPRDWLLENLLVFFWCTVLIISYQWFPFSNFSYGLFVIFLCLHIAGSHYTYSQTPFGFWLQKVFAFDRNHYDRIVHFSFGLLLAYPMREILLEKSGVKQSWSYFITLNIILAFGAIYEIIEACAAVIVSPELGIAFLGAQGDEWDAQMDAALSALGAITAMLICWLTVRIQGR